VIAEAPELVAEVRGCVGVITLNRPKVLNSLNTAMLQAMYQQLRHWADDPSVATVVVCGAGPSFCAGGDVRAVWEHRGDDCFMDEVYRIEYILDEYINRYPKPYVALMTGITMGGGCGISVHGAFRVVTETTTLAMPEVQIGLYPDVAGSYFLSRCPGWIGLYMGLAGARLNAADTLYTGIASHCVYSCDLSRLVERLAAGEAVESSLAKLYAPPPEGTIERLRPSIDECFGRDSVRSIVAALNEHGEPWAKQALDNIRASSPTSLEIAFRAIREGRGKNLRDCLIADFRIAQRLMKQNDYFEGVRALIIDKDRKPRWNPSVLEDVSQAARDAYFAPLPPEVELTFPD
jgi:enoyl-CoA hydratase